jgi:ABC-2 type transport system permease protein
MATTDHVRTAGTTPSFPPRPTFPTRLLDVLASEWTKVRSLRSTFWLLVIAAVTALGGSTILAFSERSSSQPVTSDPVASVFLPWLEYPILAVGILGVLSLTSEFTTGQIRTTFAAVPQRLAVLAAKVGVTGIVALLFGEALAFASFLTTEAIVGDQYGSASLSDPGVLRAVAAAGVCLFAVAVIGVGLGAIIRNTAGAVAALPALIYLPLVALTLPHPWDDRIGRFGLLTAAYQLVSVHAHGGLLQRPLALVVVLAWAVAAVVVAGVLIQQRDA